EINGPINLALKGQLMRTLTRVDYSERIDGDTRYPAVNVANYSYTGIAKLWMVLNVLMVVLGLALIAWTGQSGSVCTEPVGAQASASGTSHLDASSSVSGLLSSQALEAGDLRTAEIGIMFCLLLLGAPLTSKIYFVALLWPLAICTDLWARDVKM